MLNIHHAYASAVMHEAQEQEALSGLGARTQGYLNCKKMHHPRTLL